MAQTTTWKINDMVRDDSTGNVKTVYWECHVSDNTHTDCSAVEGGKMRLDSDPSSDDFIPYADLTEAIVLGWVYDSLIEGEETADEAKARVEADRDAKVQGQIDAANTTSSGIPWETEE